MTTYSFDGAYRPTVLGSKFAVSAGHYLGAQAAFLILEAGGNAIDAGVAAGITLNVVEPQICSFTGVAPIMIYLGAEDRFVTIDGLGTWPRRASAELLASYGDCVPEGILQSVVPGAPDAWLTALEQYGTMSFSEVAATAIRLAREGFAAHPVMVQLLKKKTEDFPVGSAAASIFLPNGRPPEVGDLFVQKDLAKTLQFLVDEETARRSSGRKNAIAAVRECLYRGDLAKTFAAFQRSNGGLLDEDDFAAYHATIEAPHSIKYRDLDVYACGPWCQGPMLLQILRLIDVLKLDQFGHNSHEYIHGVIEVIKLVAADREAYYGDPKFVSVPLEQLISSEYAQTRSAQFQFNQAWQSMPPAGKPSSTVGGMSVPQPKPAELSVAHQPHDTSFVCVIDSDGNAFAATPSDGVLRKSPIVPGTGMAISPRGLQSRVDPAHPACVAPGKRPRLTPNPSMVRKKDGSIMAFGTPGGDLQVQAMTQVFMNLFAFGMKPQHAVEATRFYSYSYPDSFAPHAYYPGLLKLEDGISDETAEALSGLGHKVERWPTDEWPRTGVCLVMEQATNGLKLAAADSRRTGYALGW